MLRRHQPQQLRQHPDEGNAAPGAAPAPCILPKGAATYSAVCPTVHLSHTPSCRPSRAPHAGLVAATCPPQWYPEVNHFCKGVPVLLVGCKTDLRQDPEVLRELRQGRQEPVTFQQVGAPPRQGTRAWGRDGAQPLPPLSAGGGHGPAGPRRVLLRVLGQVPGERQGHLRCHLRHRAAIRPTAPTQEMAPGGLHALLRPRTPGPGTVGRHGDTPCTERRLPPTCPQPPRC